MNSTLKGLTLLALQAGFLASLSRGSPIQFDAGILSQEQVTSHVSDQVPPGLPAAPRCETIGTEDLKITCTYTATVRPPNRGKDKQRIVLNRAELSFGTKRDSYMLIDLTFMTEEARPNARPYTVYLTVDDEGGHNMVRRALPKVDFSKLTPGVPATFSERLLIGGFRPGRYIISLVIPNPEPSQKNNPASNILLSNVGVADPTIGSNVIARFIAGH